MVERYVVFSHGKDGEPWGPKITSLSETARSEGYGVESVDYRGIETVRGRIEKLVEVCKNIQGELVLCGSSLGAYVSVSAASLLLAPALLMEGLAPLRPGALDCPSTLVHGWSDTVVPYEQSVRFAHEHHAVLHLVESDHHLLDQMRMIKYLFEHFLIALDLTPELR